MTLFWVTSFSLTSTSIRVQFLMHRYGKNAPISFFFGMIPRPHQTRDHISCEYHVPGIILYRSSTYCCRCSLQQVPRLHSYEEKGDAVRIEPRPPSPNTCRLCARSSRTLFGPQASGDGIRMPSVLGESRASCRLSINSRANQSQAHSNSSASIYELPASARRQLVTPDDGSYPPHRPSPMS